MKINDKTSSLTTVQIPIALLVLTLSFLFLFPITGFSQSPEAAKRQLANARKQIAIMKENEKLHDLLVRHRLESFNMNDEELKRFEKQRDESRVKPGFGPPPPPKSTPVPAP